MMDFRGLYGKGKYGGKWNIDLATQKGDKILDLGGDGNPHPLATDVLDFEGPEASPQRGGRKLVRRPGLKIHLGKAEDLLPLFQNGEFDFVFSSHCIEHIEPLPFVLEELSRVCKRGLISAPHYYVDYLGNPRKSGHKWFLGYDYQRNILQIRRRRGHEWIDDPEILKLCSEWIGHDLMQSHYNSRMRAIWEIRFRWEGKIDFEIREDLFQEIEYLNQKWKD